MNNENYNFDTQNTENNQEINQENNQEIDQEFDREYINQEHIEEVILTETCTEVKAVFVEEPVLDERAAKNDFNRIGFGYFIFSSVTLLVALILQAAVLIVNEEFYNSHLFHNLVTPVSMYLFALPLLIGFFKSVKPIPPQKKNIGFGEWVLYLVVGLGLTYIGAIISNNIMSRISTFFGYDYTNVLNTIVDGGDIWVTAIFAVIIAPIGEEIVFRKLLIDRTGKYGCVISAILSAVIFGLMHANLFQMVYAAALGFMFGYIYYNTGRVIYTIGIHAGINFFGTVVSTLLSNGLADLDMNMLQGDVSIEFLSEHAIQIILLLAYSAFTYAAMVAAIVLPIVFRKRLRFGKGDIKIPVRKRMSIMFLNAGMICALVFYVIETLLSLIPT